MAYRLSNTPRAGCSLFEQNVDQPASVIGGSVAEPIALMRRGEARRYDGITVGAAEAGVA